MQQKRALSSGPLCADKVRVEKRENDIDKRRRRRVFPLVGGEEKRREKREGQDVALEESEAAYTPCTEWDVWAVW